MTGKCFRTIFTIKINIQNLGIPPPSPLHMKDETIRNENEEWWKIKIYSWRTETIYGGKTKRMKTVIFTLWLWPFLLDICYLSVDVGSYRHCLYFSRSWFCRNVHNTQLPKMVLNRWYRNFASIVKSIFFLLFSFFIPFLCVYLGIYLHEHNENIFYYNFLLVLRWNKNHRFSSKFLKVSLLCS